MFERALPALAGTGPAGQRPDHAGPGQLAGGRARRGRPAAAVGQPGRRAWSSATSGEATADWRWFEPTLTYDNALLPLALFKGLPPDRRAGQPARGPRVAGVPGGDLLSRRAAGAGGQRRLALPRRGQGAAPTSRPSTPPPSCWPSAAPTWPPAITTTCAGCASRSPGSWAPTGWACRSTTSPPPAAATAWASPSANQNQGAESTISLPAVAARDAGAGRRRPRARPADSGPVIQLMCRLHGHAQPATGCRPIPAG